MAKYDTLRDHLLAVSNDQRRVVLSFTELDRVVGGLPESARRVRQFWANDSKGQARAWRAAGWHVAELGVDFNGGTVTFERGRVGGSRLDGSAAVANAVAAGGLPY